MKDLTNSKIEVRPIVIGYILYMYFVWICDALDFSCYLLNFIQTSIASRMFAIAIVFITIYKCKRFFIINHKKRSKSFYIVIALILLYSFIRSLIPDLYYDTCLSLFINIFPGFNDIINTNVFPTGLQAFYPTLNNHMFYLFYKILGYRMGTLLNPLSIIVSYSIIIDIFELLSVEYYEKVLNNNEYGLIKQYFIKPLLKPEAEIFSLLILFTHYITINISEYLVDIIPGPLVLEMLRITIKSFKSDNKPKSEMLYFALIAGLSLAMKMTNITTTITMLIAYLFVVRKDIKKQVLYIGAIIVIIPICPYIIYSYISTGNPVYPFFNSIFKSPYFFINNFKDSRWGPASFLDSLIWPIKPLIVPVERLGEMGPFFKYAISLGIIACIGLLIITLYKKKLKTSVYPLLVVLFIAQVYLWVFTTGYGRYAAMQEMFAGILLYCFILELVQFNKKILANFLSTMLLICLIVQFSYGQFSIVYQGIELGWRPQLLKEPKSYINNLKFVFNDKGVIGTKEQREKIDYTLPIYPYSNLNYLFGNDKPMINLQYLYMYGTNEVNPSFTQQVISKVKELEKEGKGIYSAVPNILYPNIAESFNLSKQYIYGVEFASSYFEPTYRILLIKTGLSEENENKLVYVSDETQFKLRNENNKLRFTGILAMAPYVTWENPTTLFTIEATDGKNTKIVFQKEIDILKFYDVDVTLDLSGLEGNIDLKYKHTYLDGNPTNWNCMTVLNPKVQPIIEK